ncbi:LysR family transcriptional regulator [Fulvivirga sp. RKSG066]|uniref:LysR family transcriptional regulator n=1 Tax=Fulvivirga aurantia TaxID=2529383 RepID=UPI0012BBFFA1|nr:LysR family transcriptional regulator [Fulvivirga aurantia]MTI23102.1 LysR family transcriptional regulator [Fulvivirga aurantia]
MEVRHLRLIKAVAEKGSLTKAMETLYLSQSALSHQLKELETQLGAQLFHRVNKKLVLTGAGKIVLQSAERVLKEIDKAEKAVKKYIGGDEGSMRVATECYTCYHWLPSLMVDFNREFPNVEIEISPETANDPVNNILNGKLDLAIASGYVDNPNIRTTELFTDELLAVVPADHPWAGRKYVKAQDFESESMIIHSFPLDSVTVFRRVLIPENVKPKKVTAIQITEAALEMVKAGMGVKVIAKWIVEPYLHDKRLAVVPVTKKGLFRTWYALTLKQSEPPQYIENFIDHLKCNIGGVCKPALSY